MPLPECADRGCMRLAPTKRRATRNHPQARNDLPGRRASANRVTRARTVFRKLISEWIFDNCIDCSRMSVVPQGAFAACKVRDNLERGVPISHMNEEELPKDALHNARPMLEGWELTPLKYNSKLMNSIWGLYNRYSVHNFKKNNNSNSNGLRGAFAATWCTPSESRAPAANAVVAAAEISAAATANLIQNGNGLPSPL